MQRPSLILLIPLLGVPAGSPLADSAEQLLCPRQPLFGLETASPDEELGGAALLTADRFDLSQTGVSRADGNVRLEQEQRILHADSVSYEHEAERAQASGNVRYQDPQVLLTAEHTLIQLDQRYARLSPVRYQLRDQAGAGDAAEAERQGDELTRMRDVTYSTCSGPRLDWMLRARELTLDHEEGFGDARGVSFLIRDHRVAYLPRASFPIDERRRSGFLYPSAGISSRTGFDLTVPYYLNLAPNYDATLLPRLLTRRGVMLGGEFRYLGERSRGELEAHWLPSDREARRDRGSVAFRHTTLFSRQWRLDANINRVSDNRYFEDLGDSLAGVATTLLGSRVSLRGNGEYWRTTLSADAFQNIDPDLPERAEPYRRLPRVELFAGPEQRNGLDYGLRAEAVNFQRDIGETGQRYDLMPFIALPAERAWGFVRPELAYRQTGYRLDREQGDSNPDRGLPIASIDAGLFFDRSTRFGRQSLEPRMYYLYVPHRDQDDLPLFDSNEMTFSFGQLFRTNRFTGADRQQDANQLALAVTSRLFEDSTGRELLAASLGQIRYFTDQRVQLPNRPQGERSASAWLGEIAWRPTAAWTLINSVQWDSEQSQRDLLTSRLQYRFGERGVANLSYRYRRDFIEQVDTSFSWPVAERWNLIGRWNHSLLDKRTLETLAGVEYESCCYAMRLVARQYVRNTLGERSNAVFFEIEFKGLGSIGRRTDEFLQRTILGYNPGF